MCAQRLGDGPLVCVRTDAHDTHVFHATTDDLGKPSDGDDQ